MQLKAHLQHYARRAQARMPLTNMPHVGSDSLAQRIFSCPAHAAQVRRMSSQSTIAPARRVSFLSHDSFAKDFRRIVPSLSEDPEEMMSQVDRLDNGLVYHQQKFMGANGASIDVDLYWIKAPVEYFERSNRLRDDRAFSKVRDAAVRMAEGWGTWGLANTQV